MFGALTLVGARQILCDGKTKSCIGAEIRNHSHTKMAASGIAVGLNKGRKTNAKESAPKISYRKGALSQRTSFVRNIVKEVAGLAPYERRLIELIRNAGEKRAKKLAKKRLGTHKRALRKVEEMTAIIAESRKH